MKRAIIIVLDGVGIGEMPDAEKFSDKGADTLGHIDKKIKNFKLPNLERLGLGCIKKFKNMDCSKAKNAKAYGICMEKSNAKDTVIGHWEIAGLITKKPFPLFPKGFPESFIKLFEKKIGRKTLGNKHASGTKIIEELGEIHLKTGFPIVYTSADSVFQIAAHRKIISVNELYEICLVARSLLKGKLGAGRVIARPFDGKKGKFYRTHERKDFSLKPPKETLLDAAIKSGLKTYAIGKIYDIFAGKGITEYVKTKNNKEGLNKTLKALKEKKDFSLIFTNLVDTDMLYGHRRDIEGYKKALEEIDSFIPKIINNLKEEDLLILTADHGCDPAFKGTDHTREYVPLIVYGKNLKSNVNLNIRKSFSDIAKTISEYLELRANFPGRSFLKKII